MIKYRKDTENIATLVLDMGKNGVNIINHEIADAFLPVLKYLQQEKSKGTLRGVIITSAKSNFLEGGELDYISQVSDPKEVFDFTERLKGIFRALEHPGVPVVAAINGNAMGLGFEMALACHHRIVIDNPKLRLGLTEVGLGLMPSGGSIIRLMWLMGIERAYKILTSGRRYNPQVAYSLGMVDELVSDEKQLLSRAKDWLLQASEGRRPWDRVGGSIPSGTAAESEVAALIRRLNIDLVKSSYKNFPAQHAILNVLAEGSKVDFDTATRIESRYYTDIVCRQETKNMIQAFWGDNTVILNGLSRPKGFGKFRPKKVGIIGAGHMGSGIAYCCARRGLEVVLKDVSKLIAAEGKKRTAAHLDEKIRLQEIIPQEKTAILSLITTTDNAAGFADCDLVIEAVFENALLKQKVTKEAELQMDEYSFIGSNTLSIPISQLAESSNAPENFIGLHFFRPAERVPLVEIVKGKQTSDETVARAFDFVRAIRKVPIIVKDDWGFYVARVQNTYILEGIDMLLDGYSPALIENISKQASMSQGALSFADDLGLKIVLRYEQQAAEHYGPKYIQHPAVNVLGKMLELERFGKHKRKGFYDYSEEGEPQLWDELVEHFPTTQKKYDRTELIERFLFAQVIEAGWCLHEKVIKTIPEANLGSIYGWGFPSYQGGVIQYIKSYEPARFFARAKELEATYGQRFQMPPYLKKLFKNNKVI